MAIVCLVLGPLMLLSAAAMVGLAEAVAWAEREHLLASGQLFPDVERMLRFSELSGVVLVPLSVVTIVVAARALGDLARGRTGLLLLGWAWVAGMVVLSALWEGIAFGDGVPLGTHLTGVLPHLLQAVLIGRACFFLARPDVKAACEALPEPRPA
jgi:hypothetical protein